MALDFSIEEVKEKEGIIVGIWDSEDVELLENVKGVSAVHVKPVELPKFENFLKIPRGKQSKK